ncbi:putative molybdopterin biosynthesis protein [Desulfitobacterium sp. LBE]|uniref:molybdopterin molybdotransferase MoeA n=1 Tax=Desulfitobacterium sp. LBE TaxID=884086 RepID=UPI00119C2226|nr:molybdopterin molybdotransferase MoeA [Desulfitobacterium sp. LBE]TWH57560.1 putative molybdopterin biosynthesis protein [Desulfitobacterium sp. LBE]
MANNQHDHISCPSSSCIGCATRCHRQQNDPFSRDEALAILFDQAKFELAKEFVPLNEALGRVTSEPTYAAFSVPSADTAQHDGIMVNWEQAKKLLESGSRVLAEHEFCLRAMGAVIEPPFDTVIPLEQVKHWTDGRVEIKALPAPGQGIKGAGSSIRGGERLVPANYRLNPAHLSILRFAGVETITVWKKPKAAIIPVGDDLVAPGRRPGPGQVVESDSILLAGILQECGGEAWTEPVAGDGVDLICQAILQVIFRCDVLILIGGLGRSGARYGDYTVQAVEKLGRVLVQGMGFNPGGKAMLLAEIQGKCVVGIPAPPHAALTQAEQYLPAIMERFLSCPCYERPEIKARLHEDYQSGIRSGRHAHVGLRWTGEDYEIVPIRMGDTVDCFVNATGILMEEAEDRLLKKGEPATVRLLCGEKTLRRRSQTGQDKPIG